MPDLDLKTIRRRAMRSLLEDGILEILFGAYLLAWGVALDAGSRALPYFPFGLVVIPGLLRAAQKRFVYPRVGYADFGEGDGRRGGGRSARIAAMLIGVSIAALAVWIWRAGIGFEAWSTRMLPVLVGLLLAFGPVVFAFKYGVARWHALGALFVAIAFAMRYMNPRWSYLDVIAAQLMVSGGMLLVAGLALFVLFLRRYPVQTAEAHDDAR